MSEKLYQVWDGSNWYTNLFLRVYDWFALGFSCRYILGCKSENIIKLYNKHVSRNHLDLGCGTGFFLDRCRFPASNPNITLVDINPFSLKIAEKRLARYQLKIYVADVLKSMDFCNGSFDSVSLSHLLHCLPGDMSSKGVIFNNLKKCLTPSSVIFGSTFLADDTRLNRSTNMMFKLANKMRYMNNLSDNIDGLSELLKLHFTEYEIETIGCVAMFWARNKRS